MDELAGLMARCQSAAGLARDTLKGAPTAIATGAGAALFQA